MSNAMRRIKILLFAILLVPSTSFGDGCFLWRNRTVDILQPSQKAIIEWNGKTEKLTIETKYKGPADEMVWIVPVPSKPEIKKADLRALEEMSQTTQEPRIAYTRFVEELSPPACSASPLISREQVGVYDVAVLAPKMDAAVVKWLQDNEFPVDDTAARLIADHDSNNWYIIAARIHPDAMTKSVQDQLQEGTLHPLAVTFAADRCVYPMRMTSLAAGPVEVLLWVKADKHYVPETLANTDWDVSLHGGPKTTWSPRRSVWEPTQRDETGPTECITKLRRTFDPKTITEDLYLKEADYASLLDPANDKQVGSLATQWGLRRDPNGIAPLLNYLQHADIQDKPHIRSAIWALGECGGNGPLPADAENLLLQIAKTDTHYLGLECCVTLNKVHCNGVGPLLLTRTQELLSRLPFSCDAPPDFSSSESILLLADWFHRQNDDRVRKQYFDILRDQLGRLRRIIKATPERKFGLLDKHALWLLNEAANAQDTSFVTPLRELRRTILRFKTPMDDRTLTAEANFVQMALAACHDEPTIEQLVHTAQTELDTLEEKFATTEPKDLLDDHCSKSMFAYFSGVFKDEQWHATINPFDTTAEMAAKYLPPPTRQEIGVALLATPDLKEYCTIYLLGWLTHPETGHVETLRTIWSTDSNIENGDDPRASLALKAATIWKDAGTMKWMLQNTSQIDLKEECLTELLTIDPATAASVLTELAPAWDAKCSAANKYGKLVHPDKDFFRYQCHEDLERALMSALDDPSFNDEYRKLCSDKKLHPATRYYLLDLLGIFRDKRPEWSSPLAETLFDEVGASVSQDDYKGLVWLLQLSGCGKRLATEWDSVTEDWKKDELTGGLLRSGTPEAARVLEKMLTRNWYEQFKSITNNQYDDFLKMLGRKLFPGTSHEDQRDVLERFAHDEKIDAGYRACIAYSIAVMTVPEMKDLAAKAMPEPIRVKLQTKISNLEQ